MDLDFGYKVWYKKPSFYIKCFSLLISIVIIFYLFFVAISLSENLYKKSVSKFPLIIVCFCALSLVISTCCFVLMYFRLDGSRQLAHTISTFITSIIYFILAFAFIFACCTEGAYNSVKFYLTKYLNEHKQDHEVVDFLKNIGSSFAADGIFDNSLVIFCRIRTTDLAAPLITLTIFWLVLLILVYYSMLYAGEFSMLLETNRTYGNNIDIIQELNTNEI